MKKVLFTLLTMLFFSSISLSGQSTKIIEPGPPGVLNDAIFGDTLATGEREDPNRIYILRRGVPYLLSGTLEFSDFNLHIEAEDGPGARPLLLYNFVSGDNISQLIRTRGSGNLTLRGLQISCQDILGSFNNRHIRINSDDSRIIIDDCHFDQAGQAGIRVQGDGAKIYITNSTFTRMGRPDNPSNGRFVDNRGVDIDTLWVENTTVYDVTSRFYRDGGGTAKWIRMNQNTFWGSAQHSFNFVDVENLEFTNNLVFNPGFFPRDIDNEREDPRYVINLDTFINGETNFLISHNNFHTDQGLIDAIPLQDAEGDTIVSVSRNLFSPAAQAGIDALGTGSTNIVEDIDFEDEPPLPFALLATFVADTGDVLMPTAAPWDFSDLTPDATYSALGNNAADRYVDLHNFGYDETALSFTAGTEGQKLGADPSQLVSSAEDVFIENNILFYPNPVRNQLYLQNLEDVDLDRVAIYSMTGKLMNTFQPRAVNLMIDMSNLNPGVYVLTLIDKKGNISSRKIMKAR